MKTKISIPNAAYIRTDMAITVNHAITSLTWPYQAKKTKSISKFFVKDFLLQS